MFSFLENTLKSYITLYSFLFLIYAVGFTMMSSLFHYKKLLKKYDNDFKVFMYYFVYFSLFLFIIPIIGIVIYSSRPLEVLKSLGFGFGNYKIGLIFVLISIPISFVSGFIISNNSKLRVHYPFSKNACRSLKTFIIYEISFLVLYYFVWEFTFRGVFLFSIAEMMANGKTGILIAILVQTIISTVYHLGHPDIEIFGAFVGGIIFGVIAYASRSFLYTTFIHAIIGIVNDTFLYIKIYRKR